MKICRAITVLALFPISLLIGCQDLDLPEGTPYCIEKRIRKFNRNEACDAGASVVRYDFQGRTIYIFNPGICGADLSSAVVDRECNNVCSLGGLAGNVICDGDTISEAINEEVIWSN